MGAVQHSSYERMQRATLKIHRPGEGKTTESDRAAGARNIFVLMVTTVRFQVN